MFRRNRAHLGCQSLLLVLDTIFVFHESTTSFLIRPTTLTGQRCNQGSSSTSFLATFLHEENARHDANRGLLSSHFPTFPPREEDRCILLGKEGDSDAEYMDPPVSWPDPYGWMRDDTRKDPKVLNHIQNENEYYHAYIQSRPSLVVLKEELTEEFSAHFQGGEDKETPRLSRFSIQPSHHGSDLGSFCYYYTKYVQGQPFPLHCRMSTDQWKNATADWTAEQVLLNETELAQELWNEAKAEVRSGYFVVHSINLINRTHLAVSVDLSGDECYKVYLIRRIEQGTGNDQNQPFSKTCIACNTSGTMMADTGDGNGDRLTSLHYVGIDPSTKRAYRWMEWDACSGTHIERAIETNPEYWGELSKTSDDRFVIWTSQSLSTRIKRCILDTHTNHTVWLENETWPFQKYELDHRGGQWWILDTDTSSLFSCQSALLSMDQIVPVKIPQDMDAVGGQRFFQQLASFANHILLEGRKQGLQRVWTLSVETSKTAEIAVQDIRCLHFQEEAANYVKILPKQSASSNKVLISFESMVTPPTILELDLNDRNHRLKTLYQQERNYDPGNYECQRLLVPSRDDSVKIPVSLVYHKGLSFPCPLHLIGYGAYGHSLEPAFSVARLPLLQRGVVCAVAHVRGGGELGPSWYEDGKGANKVHSIDDFVDVATWLVKENWTNPELLAAEGRSAGGLLVAGAMNQKPALFRTVVLAAPFLDIIGTMADATLPLTTLEWEEFGNPHTAAGLESMASYAPLQNVISNSTYPSCLLIGGLQDPRVAFWEPLKFAATLRHSSRSDPERPILVRIDPSAGHSYGNNQTKFTHEMGFIYSFILDQIGAGL